MEIIGYIASVCVGVVLGILGGGGSILCIPILVYFFGLDVTTASAYSLFIVGVTSLMGAIPKYKNHLVDLNTAIVFGIPSLITIFTTRKWVVPAIPDIILNVGEFAITRRIVLLGVFALLMVLASIAMIREKAEPEGNVSSRLRIAIQGVIIGFLTGLVGAGGGFLIIPALVLLTGLKFKTAVGTSLFIIAANSLTGFVGDLLNHSIDWAFLISITLLAISGIVIGTLLSRNIPGARLRKAFGWFTLAMGIGILYKEIFLR